jgi:hypothetical protein
MAVPAGKAFVQQIKVRGAIMGKFCGTLQVGSVEGGGTVGSQTVIGDRVVSSFEVPVAIEYELRVGATHFKKIRCCEQAMAPFVAQNNGNDVCIYTFKQLPRTDVMLAIVAKGGPSYRMTAGRMYMTLFATSIFLPLLIAVPLFFIPVLGWVLSPLVLFFAGRNGVGLWSTWQKMNSDGVPGNG